MTRFGASFQTVEKPVIANQSTDWFVIPEVFCPVFDGFTHYLRDSSTTTR